MRKYFIENYDFKKLNSNLIVVLFKVYKYQLKLRFICKYEYKFNMYFGVF